MVVVQVAALLGFATAAVRVAVLLRFAAVSVLEVAPPELWIVAASRDFDFEGRISTCHILVSPETITATIKRTCLLVDLMALYDT